MDVTMTVTKNLGDSVTFTAIASGGTGQYIDYTWSGLPTPLQSENKNVITGIPSAIGIYNVTITVTDSKGDKAFDTGQLIVVQPQTEKKFEVYDILKSDTKIGVEAQQNDSGQYQKTQACQEILNRLFVIGTDKKYTVFNMTWDTGKLRGVAVIIGGKDNLEPSAASLKACNIMGNI